MATNPVVQVIPPGCVIKTVSAPLPGHVHLAALCEAYAARHSWRLKSGGRLDTYRAANWILRSALAGKNGVNLAFLPPIDNEMGDSAPM